MAQHHNYNVSNIEDMIPFELDLYCGMLVELLEKQQEQVRG